MCISRVQVPLPLSVTLAYYYISGHIFRNAKFRISLLIWHYRLVVANNIITMMLSGFSKPCSLYNSNIKFMYLIRTLKK